jgi:choline dehydrogenase
LSKARALPTPAETPSRRQFIRTAGACVAAGALAGGCASFLGPGEGRSSTELSCAAGSHDANFDYVVVGSGAGGGPLAANLARAGFRVLLLEAGGEEDSYDYQVPAFHARASEDERFSWEFFVRHYADDRQQRRDEKFVAARDGVLYPRCATLGGCTAHNALILLYPHNSDWDSIAEVTGDRSWTSENMRRYFERLERCEYVPWPDAASGHGFQGWLPSSVADPMLMVGDRSLQALFAAAALESLATSGRPLARIWERLGDRFDPNSWQWVRQSGEGICATPLSTAQGRRAGSREYIRRVQQACTDRLTVQTHSLATRVIFDERRRATGVEYLVGESLYRADPRGHTGVAPTSRHVSVRREVILCAGAFNTPQLLKLSGIGPRGELERHGIPVRVDLPGVGENLQDRYEVCVVTRTKSDFSLLRGMQFRPPHAGEEPDAQFREWLQGRGPYTTNGAVVSMMKRSVSARPEPDLFIFGLLGYFKGYYPGYSNAIARGEDFLSWAVLKAHTNNSAGRVALRSADPRDVPAINFHYFAEGNDQHDEDLVAVVEGVKTVRRIIARCQDVIAEEVVPGPGVRTDGDIAQFVRDNAWGHHASCTCRIGPASDPMAVVDGRFRVHGTKGLRVVDASVFPRIPGFFIAAAVYMVSEKASDVIIEDAARGTLAREALRAKETRTGA